MDGGTSAQRENKGAQRDDDGRLDEWVGQQTSRLSEQPILGYADDEPAAGEPVAIAAITACSYQLKESAEAGCRCLLAAQNSDGSVSARLDDQGPYWTTSIAAIAWRQYERTWGKPKPTWCIDAYRKAIDFLTSYGGRKIRRSADLGHNTQLVGWPWVEGTHSWMEPTAMALMAMRQCGFAKHPRAIEAAKLLMDRQLTTGGANYGNTSVLGQPLRPHVLPSAMSLVALHRFQPQPDSLAATLVYLQNELKHPLGAISLAWAIHAIVSAKEDQAGDWESELDPVFLAAINRFPRTAQNPHRQNLLLLAIRKRESPLLDLAYHSFPHQTKRSRS